jgi:hypothetical protein
MVSDREATETDEGSSPSTFRVLANWRETMFIRIIAACGAVLVLAGSSVCEASNCNPRDFKDLMISTEDVRKDIIFSDELKKRNQLDAAHHGAGDFIGWANFSDAGQLNYLETLQRTFNANITYEDQSKLLYSALSGVGAQAYADCLKNDNHIIFVDPMSDLANLGSNQFTVSVRLQ